MVTNKRTSTAELVSPPHVNRQRINVNNNRYTTTVNHVDSSSNNDGNKALLRTRWNNMTIQIMKQECDKHGLVYNSKTKKSQLVELLVQASIECDNICAQDWTDLSVIQRFKEQLNQSYQQVYGNNNTSELRTLLNTLNVMHDQVESSRVTIGIDGPLGAGKSFFINDMVLRTCDGCKLFNTNELIGKNGPLPSLDGQSSVTVLATSIEYAENLSVTYVLPNGNITSANLNHHNTINYDSMKCVRSAIQSLDYGVSDVTIHGPFPGLLMAQEELKLKLRRDVKIRIVDLPGRGDIGNYKEERKSVLSKCDVILGIGEGQHGRLMTAKELVEDIIGCGAISSYIDRPTLVLFSNYKLLSGATSNKPFDKLVEDARMEWNKQLDLLQPYVADDNAGNSGDGNDNGDVVTNNSETANNLRVELTRMLMDKSLIQLHDPREASELMDRIREEADVLMFAKIEDENTNNDEYLRMSSIHQLINILYRCINGRVTRKRHYPLLDMLQKAAKQMKTRAVTFINRQDTSQIKVKAADRLKKLLLRVSPIVRFDPTATRQVARLLINRMTNTDFVSGDMITNDMRQQLRLQAIQMLCTCMETFMASIDKAVQETLREYAIDSDAQLGFLRAVPETYARRDLYDKTDQISELLNVYLLPAINNWVDIRKNAATKSTLKQYNSLYNELVDERQQQQAGMESEHEEDDENASVASAAVDTKNELDSEVCVRFLLHQISGHGVINSKRSNIQHEIATLIKTLSDEIKFKYIAAFEQHISDMPSSITPTDAKNMADELDAIAMKIRACMVLINPACGIADRNEYLTSTSVLLPLPQQMKKDEWRKLFSSSNAPYTVKVHNINSERFITNRTKTSFKLSTLVNLFKLKKKCCLQQMYNAGLLTTNDVEQLRETNLILPVDTVEASQKFAAALAKVAIDYMKLDVSIINDADQYFRCVTSDIYRAAQQALWYVQKSQIKCTIDPSDKFTSSTSMETSLLTAISTHREKGNNIIYLRRDVNSKTIIGHTFGLNLDELSDVVVEKPDSICPIVMPSIRSGSPGQPLGNIWLDSYRENPAYDFSIKQQLGMEDKPVIQFVLVEPRHLNDFIANYGAGTVEHQKHRQTRVYWVVLPFNYACWGMSITCGKLLMEALKVPHYFTIDDDIDYVEQYDKPGRWYAASFRRMLLFGQIAFNDVMNDRYINIESTDCSNLAKKAVRNYQHQEEHKLADLLESLTETSTLLSRAVKERGIQLSKQPRPVLSELLDTLPADEKNHIGDALLDYTIKEVEVAGTNKADGVAGMSVAHLLSKKSGYVHKYPANYRPSTQRYQVVLHNTIATIGHNMVSDDILFTVKPFHALDINDYKQADLDQWRRWHASGAKGSDKIWNHGLQLHGKYGCQVFNFVHSKLHFANVLNGESYLTTDAEDSEDE